MPNCQAQLIARRLLKQAARFDLLGITKRQQQACVTAPNNDHCHRFRSSMWWL